MARHKIGVKYGLPSVFYPRFEKLQRRLHSLVPRFRNILDKGRLSQCIPDGKFLLLDLTAASKHLEGRVSITVVGENQHDLQEFDQDLRVWQTERIPSTKEMLPWAAVLKEAEKSTRQSLHLTVYLLDWCTPEKIHECEGLFSLLSEDQLGNVIIYDKINNKNFLYTDVKASGDNDLAETKYCTNLSQQIQFLLEKKAVEMLVDILVYVNNFVPKPGVDPDQTLLDECSKKIQHFLRYQDILGDLDPNIEVKNESETMETDSAQGTSYASSSIKSTDELFKEKMVDFVGKMVKCIICSNLSMKYGVNASIVNEFLNEDFHNFRGKYKESCLDMFPLSWQDVKTGKRANYLNYLFITQQSTVILDAECYVKDQLENLNEMSKMAFEIHALLRQTVVPLKITIPKYQQLSKNLQNSLLSIPQIQGCGTVYGKLTLHISKELPLLVKQEVKDTLLRYHYLGTYEYELIQNNVKQAGPAQARIECGNEVHATLTDCAFQRIKTENDRKNVDTSKEKTGSLGCFMALSKGHSNVIDDTIISNESNLYAITCAHCITECLPEVKVKVGSQIVDLGITENYIDDGERMDIAVIKVDNIKIPLCDNAIDPFNRDWRLYDGDAGDPDLQGRVVTKRGCASGGTVGIVTCNDYRTKTLDTWNNETKFNFNENYNILVGVEPGSTPDTEFSKRGDSGATIYYEESSEDGMMNKLIVVSLLQGSMTKHGKYYCTYSCHLKRSLEEICNKHDYQMDYPRDPNCINSMSGLM